ncbi:MAG: hypothetical protein ABSG81_05505 [Acidimicrobiales bacterium]
MSSTSELPARTLRHAEWELPEVLAAVVLVAFVLITVTSVVSGIVSGVGQEEAGFTAAQVVGVAMGNASSWADPPFAFVLLVGVGLVWWQVRIWSAEIELAGATDGDEAAPEGDSENTVLVAAFDHLLRAKSLATWALPLLVVVLSASVADIVSSFLLYRGTGVGGGAIWSSHIESIGFACATWVLVLAGLVAALYVRTQVSLEFTLAEEAAGAVAGDAGTGARRGAAAVLAPDAPSADNGGEGEARGPVTGTVPPEPDDS